LSVASTRLQSLIRSAEPESLDLFLVAAVLTVLTLRVYLKATNYPQIGGGGLHIAQVLWGGLGMVVAIAILLSFVTPGIRPIAALIGGIGFDAFIDELGKFVTSDNNYFFKPTAALIYVVFAVLVLTVRWVRYGTMTPTESLVNAIELSKDLAAGRLQGGEGRENRGHHWALSVFIAVRRLLCTSAPDSERARLLSQTRPAKRYWLRAWPKYISSGRRAQIAISRSSSARSTRNVVATRQPTGLHTIPPGFSTWRSIPTTSGWRSGNSGSRSAASRWRGASAARNYLRDPGREAEVLRVPSHAVHGPPTTDRGGRGRAPEIPRDQPHPSIESNWADSGYEGVISSERRTRSRGPHFYYRLG
jgi:hypothetical protein